MIAFAYPEVFASIFPDPNQNHQRFTADQKSVVRRYHALVVPHQSSFLPADAPSSLEQTEPSLDQHAPPHRSQPFVRWMHEAIFRRSLSLQARKSDIRDAFAKALLLVRRTREATTSLILVAVECASTSEKMYTRFAFRFQVSNWYALFCFELKQLKYDDK
ncbi:unnamed protein product [Amoebophrya sp. A120]|nr:unnamed protein product [Amoebophrya sp. A120]|eukprot:GSA120T00011806001.1